MLMMKIYFHILVLWEIISLPLFFQQNCETNLAATIFKENLC